MFSKFRTLKEFILNNIMSDEIVYMQGGRQVPIEATNVEALPPDPSAPPAEMLSFQQRIIPPVPMLPANNAFPSAPPAEEMLQEGHVECASPKRVQLVEDQA